MRVGTRPYTSGRRLITVRVGALSPQLVVIVDDSSTNLKILQRHAELLGEGISANTFVDREAALSFCAERRPNLVVLGATSDQGDAAGFFSRLWEQSGPTAAPVIVVGCPEESGPIERALEAGAADHLLTPIDPVDFRLRAQRQLRARPVRRSRAEPIAAANDANRPEPAGLRRAHEMLLRVIDIIPRMICVTDQDGRYLVVNRHFASFVGTRPSRLIGRRPVEVHDGPLARSLFDSGTCLLAGKAAPISSEEEVVDSDGNARVLMAHRAVFQGDEEEESMVVTVLLDITERKRAERDLLLAKEEAERANRTMGEFVANMSHELRTPLNAILGFSQVIAGEMLGPIGTAKYIGYARDILASAEHLLGIINDILDVSKLEAGRLDLAEELIDPAKAMTDLVQLAEAKARVSEVHVRLRSEAPLPALRADARKVKQIVLNLLMNAIKFSHAGGEVEIVLRSVGGAVSISVVDHGIGMDAAEVETAMSRFGQVASTWTRGHDGTGLGLPLAIGLTELHGGSLAIRSSKGIGTTVTVTFPRERSQQAPIAIAGEIRAFAGP
jgi:two-component system, cell cycle sensor histidine kinase PleC